MMIELNMNEYLLVSLIFNRISRKKVN